MTECISQLPLEFHPTLPITIAFDAPQISSDGGAILLRQMDARLGLSKWLAALLPGPNPTSVTPGAIRITGGMTDRDPVEWSYPDETCRKD